MTIHITGVDQTPSWVTLQDAIRQMLHDDSGRITRISRPDNNCNYRALGLYDLTYVPERGDEVKIQLLVRR